MGAMSGFMGVMVFGPLLVVLLLIAAIVWLLRERRDRTEAPLTTVQRRYARGEITREEYDRLRLDLADRG